MRLAVIALPILALTALGGCATSAQSAPSSPGPVSAVAAAAGGESTQLLRWTGSLKPTTQRSGNLGMADQARAFGNVSLTRSADSPNRTDVQLTITTPGSAANTTVPWAVLPGRCGSGSVPLVSIEQFGPIDIAGNSRGQINASIALTLPETGTYHVNVYWSGGSQLSDVMTCGNLSRSN